MRSFVLLLLLANLLVLAWQRWIVPPDAPDALALQARRSPELALARPAAAPGRLAGPLNCARIGPFTDAATARRGAGLLADRGVAGSVEAEPVEVWLGHWVQVPGLANRAAADGARDGLVAAGLKDAYVVRADDGFKVSLGVFRDRGRADRVAQIARGAGFEVLMTDRTRDGEEFWLVAESAGIVTGDFAALAAAGDRILRSEPVACPPDAGRGDPRTDSVESSAAAASTPE
jgi:hypothetical protein